MGGWRQDLRFILRSLGRAPGSAVAAVVTLALGVGLTTAVCAVTYGILFRPLPYARPDRLVLTGAGDSLNVGKSEIDEWAARLRTVDDIAAYSQSERFTIRGAGEPRVVDAAIVSDRFFRVLGLSMERGRPIVPGGPVNEVVVSHRLCHDLEAGGRDVLGRTLTIGDRAFVVAGVAPSSLGFPSEDVDVWLRLDAVSDQSALGSADVRGYQLVARLRDGATLAQLTDDARRVEAELDAEHGRTRPAELQPVTPAPLGRELADPLRPALTALTLAALLVLAIAGANVAALLVARTLVHQRDFAVRLALGAGRWRLVCSALTESAVVTAAGAALGLALAATAVRVFTTLSVGQLPRLDAVRVDLPVLGATAVAAILVALVAGLAPALHATRADAAALIGRAGASTRQGRHLRAALVTLQIALSVILVVGAGLLARTVSRLLSTDAGFEPRDALTVRLQLADTTRYDAAARAPFLHDLLERLRAMPAVRTAGVGGALPPGTGFVFMSVVLEDESGHRERIMMNLAPITEGYLPAIGARLLAGRDFIEADAVASPPVTILSESAVPFFFKDQDPVGRDLPSVLPGTTEKPRVVGVARDVKYSGLDRPRGTTMWLPWQRLPASVVFLVLRTAGDPLALAPDVRSVIRSLDPAQPIATLRSLEDVVSASVAAQLLRGRLATAFAVLALVVAMVGLMGLVARSVVERRRELAIRRALGASPWRVLRTAMAEAVGVTLAGVVLGLGGAALAGRALGSLLFGVMPLDPVTYVAGSVAVAAFAIVAAWVPAHRAADLGPAELMREE